jgi:predicted dehydrogenase
MKLRRFRTALVGFGATAQGLSRDRRMARYFRYATHAQVLSEHPRFEWVATMDPDRKARERARRWSGGMVTNDLAQLAALEPEVAVIAGPPEMRLECLRRLPSLRAVMVEKPLGHDLAAARRFVSVCARRRIRVQVCLWRRGDASFRRLAEPRSRRLRLGRIQAAFGLYGNGLRNNGVHLVDFLRMQGEDIVAAQALGPARAIPGAPLRDDVAVPLALRLSGGGVATFQPVDFARYREVALDLWGTQGRRSFYQESLAAAEYPLRTNRGVGRAREIATDAPRMVASTVGTAFWNLYENLADALQGRAVLWSNGSNALVAETVIDAVLRSAAQGGRVIELNTR